jgi:hypothetical protein
VHVLFLFRVGIQQLFVRIEDPFFEVGKPFIQCAVHEAVSIQDHAVKDEIFGLCGAIGQLVDNELAVDERVDVKAFDVSRDWEM